MPTASWVNTARNGLRMSGFGYLTVGEDATPVKKVHPHQHPRGLRNRPTGYQRAVRLNGKREPAAQRAAGFRRGITLTTLYKWRKPGGCRKGPIREEQTLERWGPTITGSETRWPECH